jgi:hypothetical protein
MKILKITTYWSAEEADCIYQLLDELKEAVWAAYGEEILKMHQEIRDEKAEAQCEDFNDEIQF